ncbi:M15 family metallopeptidase [Myxococcota bacterium]
MNAEEYCELVEQKDLLQKQRRRTVRVVEDNSPLISLKDSGFNLVFEPSIKEDYRYLVREAAFEKVGRISKRLDDEEKALIIRSVWRSFSHQRLLWQNRVDLLQRENPEIHQNQIRAMAEYFIAPETKSMHATGGAVDALIFDLKADRVMDFGTNDGLNITLSRRCYPLHPDITPQAKRNRELLIGLFEEEGLVCDIKEYWHFDFGNIIWAIQKNEAHARYGIIESF